MTAGNMGEFPESRSKKRKTIVKRSKPDTVDKRCAVSQAGPPRIRQRRPRLNPCRTGNEILTCLSKSKNVPMGSSNRAGSSMDTILNIGSKRKDRSPARRI